MSSCQRVTVRCQDCQKQWQKVTYSLAGWKGRCPQCYNKSRLQHSQKTVRVRNKTACVCKSCQQSILVRTDYLKSWSGNCKQCASKRVASLRTKSIPRICIDCPSKISSTSTGRCKPCAGKLRSGSQHYKWKGGITSRNKYERVLFVKFSKPKILKRDDYTCKECGVRGMNLHIDHIKPWAKHPELRFEPTNCITLCMNCHYKKTFNRPIPEGIIWGNNITQHVLH